MQISGHSQPWSEGNHDIRGVILACCRVVLDRSLIPTAFVADMFRSARVPGPLPFGSSFGEGLQTPPCGRPWSPGDAPTVGDWETRSRRGRRVRRPLPEPAPHELPGRGVRTNSPTPDRRPDAPATALPPVESESRHVTAKNTLRAATCRRGAGGDRGKEQLPQRDPANRSPTTRSHPPATMLYKRAPGHQS